MRQASGYWLRAQCCNLIGPPCEVADYLGAFGSSRVRACRAVLRRVAVSRARAICDSIPACVSPFSALRWLPQSPYALRLLAREAALELSKKMMCNRATTAAGKRRATMHFFVYPIHGPKSSRSCGKTRSRCSGSTSVEPHDSASLRVVGSYARWGEGKMYMWRASNFWLAGLRASAHLADRCAASAVNARIRADDRVSASGATLWGSLNPLEMISRSTASRIRNVGKPSLWFGGALREGLAGSASCTRPSGRPFLLVGGARWVGPAGSASCTRSSSSSCVPPPRQRLLSSILSSRTGAATVRGDELVLLARGPRHASSQHGCPGAHGRARRQDQSKASRALMPSQV